MLDSGTHLHVPEYFLSLSNILERVLIGFVTIADGKIFLIFRPRWFFLKGFTKEFSALKSRVFTQTAQFFLELHCSRFFIFWGFLVLFFAMDCYIFEFWIFYFLCFYSTYKNGVEPGKLSIFYWISWKCYFFIFGTILYVA